MGAGRFLGVMGLLVAVTPAGWAQTCTLAETMQASDCFKIQLEMKLSGEMRIRKDDKTIPLKLEAVANHEYPERILAVAPGGLVQKTARIYETAKATITVGTERVERTLRPERRLFVAQRYKDQGLVYSPSGALSREELDLTAGQFDSSAVSGVLAGKDVAVGDTWKVPASVVQALCNFEGLTEHTLTGKLDAVTAETATFSLTGTATGIDLGAIAKVKIEAVGHFDLKAKRLVSLEWKQKDERDQGPVSPVTVVESTTTLKRQAIEQPAALSDVSLVSVPADEVPPTPMTQLEYRDSQGRFAFLHPREWHITAQTKDHLVMRFMEHGDFVAQVTMTPWKKTDKGKHLSAEEFKQTMNNTAGWEPEKELQASEVPADNGRWIYRFSALGQMDGVAAVQNFYLVATAEGEQMILVFTMTPKQVDKLGARDLALVGNLEIPAAAK
ncbi:MAG TPA: hypothetical protein VN688_13720 [Gemmataceae bacterium]|nr:hypothetical protein [Gemmataceae bacterium]